MFMRIKNEFFFKFIIVSWFQWVNVKWQTRRFDLDWFYREPKYWSYDRIETEQKMCSMNEIERMLHRNIMAHYREAHGLYIADSHDISSYSLT